MKKMKNDKIIRKNPISIWLGAVSILLWGGIDFYLLFNTIKDEYYIVLPACLLFFALTVFFVYLFLLGINWKIEIKDNHIVFTNFIGVKKKVLFDNLSQELKFTRDGIFILWNGSKKLTIVTMYDRNAHLLSFIKWKTNKT